LNITPYFNKAEYLQATAEQIHRDFELQGIEIKFSGNAENAYNELLYQIVPHIARLIESNYKKLLDLLYRIDVNESKVSAIVSDSSVESLAEAISDLIIKRELQKIVIRKHYKSDNQDLN
jgi:hypothetical protein